MNIVHFDKEKKYIRDFLSLPKSLYTAKDNMEDPDSIKKFLNGTHPLSKYFTLAKFLVYDNGKPVGRFAVTTYPDNDTAYLGFYECTDDDRAAKYLFEQAVSFCREKGYAKIVGPVDGSFWQKYRLKINMFDRLPYTGEPYNKPYYFRQFTDNGFTVAEHYTSNQFRAVDESYRNEKFEERFKEFLSRGYRIESPTEENYDSIIDEVYDMIMHLYSDFPIFKSLTLEDFREIYSSYKLIMNMSMTKIAFYKDKAVGFYISIPDYSNRVYHAGLFSLPKLMKIKKKPSQYVMLYMGVRPEHRGLGKALVYSIMQELEKSRLPSIGALARDGKPTQRYAFDDVTDVYEYVLLEHTLQGGEPQ